MAAAATITQAWMLELYNSLPHYFGYHRRTCANHDEASFRLAIGHRLQDLGQRLLDGADARPHLLTNRQHELIELLAEDITTIMKLLNRTGVIRIGGDLDDAIKELQTIDGELLILIESMWQSANAMFVSECAGFETASCNLAACFEAFLLLAEERNSLMGLGWESEFGRSPDTRIAFEYEDDA